MSTVAAPRSAALALEFDQLGYRYTGSEHLALEDIDLAIEPGEFIVLAGGSGSGKTSLLRVLTGAFRPDAGEVLFRLRP